MRILFIQNESSKIFNGGVENHVRNIRTRLDKKNIENMEINFDFLRGIKVFGHKIFFPRDLFNLIININPDVIHLHGVSSTIVICTFYYIKKIKSLINVRLVYTPHFHPFKYHKRPLIAEFLFDFFIKKNIGYVDKLICLTDQEKKLIYEISGKNNISIIPNGIDLNKKIKETKYKKKIKSFLLIGRKADNKNFNFILKLFKKKDFLNLNLHVVTNQRQQNESNIFFYSNLSKKKLNDLYLKSDVLLVPSTYEAFSIVCLEAMKFGLILVISKNVMIKSYIDKMNFCEVLDLDENIWTKHINKLKNLNQSTVVKLSEKSFQSSLRFDWNIIIKKIFKIYGI